MKQKIAHYVLFMFLLVLTSYSTTTFSKYTQDINKKLTLNVEQPHYIVSFNKNGSNATGSTESVSCVYGTSCTLSQNGFTNNGYTFAGWNTKADGSGTTYTTSALNLTAINGNTVTLYAVWNANTYTINYDLKGGTVSSNPTTYNIETPTFSLNNPTRSGYSFVGWTGSNGTSPQTTVSITKGSTGDKSFTANWNRNISNLTISLSNDTYTYDGSSKTPAVTVKDGNTTLVNGVDYDVIYSNNINAGTASVTITMKNTENATHDATYVGSTTKSFTINKATPVITLSNTPTSPLIIGETTSFNEKANVTGKFTNTSSIVNVATVSPETSASQVAANTNASATITALAGGTSTIFVTFIPTDTVNYNSITILSSDKKYFDITVKNKVTINVSLDDIPWNNIGKFFVKLGSLDTVGGSSGISSPYIIYDVPVGNHALSASITDSSSLVNSGKTVSITSSDGVISNAKQSLKYYTVTVNKGTCTSASGSGIYLSNQTVNISANPGTGYTFNGWTVENGGNSPADSNSETTTVSASKTTTLTANCLGNPHKLTLLYNHTQDEDFEYNGGDFEQFIAPDSMVYKFEAWGAQGGAAVTDGSVHATLNGGEGAYTSGYMYLDQGQSIYVYVGQRPSSKSGGKANNPGGWNGGGTGTWDQKDNDSSGGGGGATDFRISNSILIDFDEMAWNNAKNLRNRIMVAAGGAGMGWASANRPYGGALESTPAYNNNNIATQTSGNAFGVGGSGTNTATSSGISGGGGGYWGGHKGVASTTTASVGTGGSSFISGYTGSVAVESEDSNSPRFGSDGVTRCANGTTDNVCSQHYSGYVFTDDPYTGDTMKMLAGYEEMPSHDGDDEISTMTGNSGNGYARISIASYQKDVYFGQEVGEIPSPMLVNEDFVDEQGNYLLDENGDPVILGAQEINWLDENENPVFEHTIYNLNSDTTWHADGFRPKSYKITYNLDGGTADNPSYYNSETETFTLTRPVKPGYRFDGWTGSNGIILQKDVIIENGSFGDKEYTAHWTKGSTLTINTNGGIFNGDTTIIEPPLTNSLPTVIDIPVPIKTGHYLSAWTLTATVGGNNYGVITNNTPINSATQQYTFGTNDATLTASWVPRTDITVTFNTTGGTSCQNLVGTYGEAWNQTCEPTREGYLFDGWYDKEIGGNLIGNSGTYTDDITLYAHWLGGTAKVEYDYNINQTFSTNTMMDTYFKPDWSKAFEIDISFIPSTNASNHMLVGNYDTSATNGILINIATTNKIAIRSGSSSSAVSQQFGTVVIGEENTLHASWDPSTQTMSAELTNSLGTTPFSYVYTQLTGVAAKNLRIGALDYRQGSSNVYSAITVTNFKISEYYESPLSYTITVPDPAGHYLLFDGWTGNNGDTPEYNLTVPLNTYGTVTYVANWSPGVSSKSYKSGNYSTSNQYIKFYYNVNVAYVDQARRKAYTYERVYFYRTNTGYTTYGPGSMTIKYNGSSYTKSITDSDKITNSGITLWSRYWNARSNTFDSVSYNANGTKSVVIGISKFTHQRFSISGLPKNYTVTLPAIKSIE